MPDTISFEDFAGAGAATANPPPGGVRPPTPATQTFEQFAGPQEVSPTQKVLQGLKATGGEAAALADLALSLPGMALGLGANLGTQVSAAARGETPKLAAQAGREAAQTIGGPLTNPLQKLLTAFDSGEAYEAAKTTAGMKKLTGWLEEAGAWVEQKTGGRIPAEQVSTLVDTLMVAGGARGGDAAVDAGVKAWLAREKPKALPADFSPAKVQAVGPQRTAQQQINEMLDIKSAGEREKYNAQRRREVRKAFAEDKDYADYLKFLAEERVSRHDAWNAETARLEEAQHQAYVLGASPAKPAEVTWNDALRVLKKPGFERTAEDLITLRRFNTQALPFVATGTVAAGAIAAADPETREKMLEGAVIGGAILATKGKGEGTGVADFAQYKRWKELKEASGSLKQEVQKHVEEVKQKIAEYKDWKYNEGDKLRSLKTGRGYEITGKWWDTKKNEPHYFYRSLDGEEKGTFIANKMEGGFEPFKGPKPTKEQGFIDRRLAARMAAVGLGITGGVYLDPSNPIEGAILGALGGLAAGSVSPKGVAGVVKKIWAADDRIRINDIVNSWDGNIAAGARETNKLQHKMETTSSADGRVAVTHAIEADDLSGLSAANKATAELAKGNFAAMAELALEPGVLKDALRNYVTHLWRLTDKDTGILNEIFRQRPSGPSMSPETKHAMRRTIPKIVDGKALGLVPVSEDISVITGIYNNAIQRAVANKQLLQALKGQADKATGERLVMASDKAPVSYVPVDHPQMTGLRVHPDIAPSLRFVFDNSNPGVVARGLEGINVVTKRMAVSFSLFHAKALLDAFVGAAKVSPKMVAGGAAAGTAWALTSDENQIGKIMAGVGVGMMLPGVKHISQAAFPKVFGENSYLKQLREGGEGDVVDALIRGGLKISYERAAPAVEDVSGTFYSAMKDLQTGLDGIMPGLGTPVAAFTKLNHAVDTFMWARLHTGLKLTVAAEKYADLLKNNASAHLRNPLVPLRPKEELAAMAADFTNSIFGGLNWRRVAESASTRWGREAALAAYSPTGRRVLQVLLFAPDWTVSTTRAALQAFSEGSGLKGLIKPQTVGDLHLQYLARSAIYYVAAGDAINYAMSGHHIWDNKDPTTIDLGDGRTMQWSKHTMEPVHWLTKPGQQGLNKLGFVPRETANQLLGTEYLSTSGHAPRMKNRAEHVARQFTPIAVQQSFEAGNESGIAGFLGAPIYGKTREQRQRERDERRLKRALGR